MRILLFGDDFGIPRLLRHLPRNYVCGLVAASNRPRCHDALRQCAAEFGLALAIQPAYRSETYGEFVGWVTALQPDLIWCSSYSMILRPEVLGVPRLGGINVHGALLPEYRGSNPLQWAILEGETVTGVTLHEMSAGIDEGAIIDRRMVPLYFEDTWQMAQKRVIAATERLLSDNVPKILSARWQAVEQNPQQGRSWRRRTADDGWFDWEQPVRRIYNLIRALVAPHPGAYAADAAGNRQVFDRYLTPSEVTALKWANGCQPFGGAEICLRPPFAQDGPLLREWLAVQLEAPSRPGCCSALLHCTDTEMASVLAGQTDIILFMVDDAATASPRGTSQIFNINWRHSCAELRVGIAMDGPSVSTIHIALQQLIAFGSVELGLHRLYVIEAETNRVMIDLYERCGLVKESVLLEGVCVDNAYANARCYSWVGGRLE